VRVASRLVRRSSALVAAVAIAVCLAAPAAQAASKAAEEEAGYQAATQGAKSATATISVPTLSCKQSSYAYVDEDLKMATSNKKGVHIDALSSLVGRCNGTEALYIELISFPTIDKKYYLTTKFEAGQSLTVVIRTSSKKSSVSVTTKGATTTKNGPGFVPSQTTDAVAVYPSKASKDIKFSTVSFTSVEIDGDPLGSFPLKTLTATRGAQVLAQPTAVSGGDSFDVKYG
jgi:hypothetical protein